jgi:hypothetical protein
MTGTYGVRVATGAAVDLARKRHLAAWLLAQPRDPRQVLAEIMFRPAADLAALLGCSLFEALQEKRLAAIGSSYRRRHRPRPDRWHPSAPGAHVPAVWWRSGL